MNQEEDTTYEFPTEELFDVFTRKSKTPASPTTFTYKLSLNPNIDFEAQKKDVIDYLDFMQVRCPFKYKYKQLSEGVCEISFVLSEPAFTNAMYDYTALLNQKGTTKKWLVTYGQDFQAIEPDRLYTCSLKLKYGTSDIFLAWDNGEQMLYHFDGMSSPRYKFFKYVIDHPNTVLERQTLKNEGIINASVTKLHEMLTKTFVKKDIKTLFAPLCEADRVLMNGLVQIKGTEVITIIRQNLASAEAEQRLRILKSVNADLTL